MLFRIRIARYAGWKLIFLIKIVIRFGKCVPIALFLIIVRKIRRLLVKVIGKIVWRRLIFYMRYVRRRIMMCTIRTLLAVFSNVTFLFKRKEGQKNGIKSRNKLVLNVKNKIKINMYKHKGGYDTNYLFISTVNMKVIVKKKFIWCSLTLTRSEVYLNKKKQFLIFIFFLFFGILLTRKRSQS